MVVALEVEPGSILRPFEILQRLVSVILPERRPPRVLYILMSHFPSVLEHLHLSIVIDYLIESLQLRRFDLFQGEIGIDYLNLVASV